MKSPCLKVSATEEQQKPHCVTNIILMLNPNHSTVRAIKKKTNSITAETRHKEVENLSNLLIS